MGHCRVRNRQPGHAVRRAGAFELGKRGCLLREAPAQARQAAGYRVSPSFGEFGENPRQVGERLDPLIGAKSQSFGSAGHEPEQLGRTDIGAQGRHGATAALDPGDVEAESLGASDIEAI